MDDLARPLKMTACGMPDSVALLRHAVVRYARGAGVAEGVLDDVALAVSEAATNSVLHAFGQHGADGVLTVQAQLLGNVLSVSVTDDGCGLTPRADSPGMGLGLPLMARLSSQLEIRKPGDGGTEVRMSFCAGPR